MSKARNYAIFKMSNHHPPNQSKAKQKKSGRNSTPDAPSVDVLAALQSAVKAIQEANELNARLLDRERPLIDFHSGVVGVNDSDIRIYWDIRIVRGTDQPFTQVTGTSSMPGMLSDKMRPHAQAQIQQEVADKMAGPLIAAFMEEAEHQNVGSLKRIANRRLITAVETTAPAVPKLPQGEDANGSVLDAAQQHEKETAGNVRTPEADDDDSPQP